MTLTLVGDPGNGNIVQHPSGLIVLRAEDFIGPARGDLTTVSDGDSVVGTVVEETQALAVPSTFNAVTTGAAMFRRWPLAADTLRIPVATLDPYINGKEDGFYAMVSMKVTGDVPTNSRYQKTWAAFRGGTCALAWGRDSTLSDGPRIWNSVFGDQYRITDRFDVSWSFLSSGTDLTMRVWGVTGGTMTYMIDMVYLMPYRTTDGLRLQYFPIDFSPFVVEPDGVLFADQDNDDTDNVIGKFSVGWTRDVGEAFFAATLLDFQDANDEPSAYNITDGVWDGSDPVFDPLDPPSWLSFIAAPHYVPQTTLISDSFAGAVTTPPGMTIIGPEGYIVTGDAGNFGGPGYPGGSGWRRDGGGNIFCGIPSSASQPVPPYAGTPHADLFFGTRDSLVGGTDPRDFTHTLVGLDDHISETTWACDTAAGEVNTLIGFQAYASDTLPVLGALSMLRNGYGVRMRLTGGVLTANLCVLEDTFVASPSFYTGGLKYDFTSPVTVDASYTANLVYRVKVERRRYQLRAKVWEDGTSEPGTWTLDEYMPFRWDETGGAGVGFIDYPYDTNWVTSATHDTAVTKVWNDHQQSVPGMTCWPEATAPQQKVVVSEFILTVDPEGSSIVDMGVQEENYDGTDSSNNLTIPYATLPSWRFVEGSLRKRHFGGDTNGFNIRAWKDGAAGPELQSSGLPMIWELGKLGVCLPQIYRLVIF